MQRQAEKVLASINVRINGHNPWDIIVHNPKMWERIAKQGSIGAGESYMDGWWDCEQLDELFFRICRHRLEEKFHFLPAKLIENFKRTLFNYQSIAKSREVAVTHYNLGNRLYELMLGKSMAYTCGYWKEANNLDEAEFAKYELICKKLYLKPGEKVLEIGCGWGGLAKYMAEKYQCQVVALDIALEPFLYAQKHTRNLPVSVYHCDYRETKVYNRKQEKFDKIVSVGVLEHVGYKNYRTLMDISRQFIKPDGIFLLHSIGGNISTKFCEPWIDKYIFPNGTLPSIAQLGKAFEKRFIVEDFQNFGAYYDNTLLAWYQNLNAHWPELAEKYNEKTRRMMNYYLLSCAGGFRARAMQLWQFVLTPQGLLKGYLSVR